MDELLEKHINELEEKNELQLPQIDDQGKDKELVRRVRALYAVVGDIYGMDKLVLKASKIDILDLLLTNSLDDRIIALQKLVFENHLSDDSNENKNKNKNKDKNTLEILNEIEDMLADVLARHSVEEELEIMISEKMQKRHEEYLEDIKKQVLKENGNPENAQTLKKLAILEKKNNDKLKNSAMEYLRPQNFSEIVGQKRAIKSLTSKVSAPFPQHILLYGPPGVGKTSAARLALNVCKKIKGSVFKKDAPFIEVNGATLRWDPRDATNPLLGSVHDPIYQGARRDFADTGIPEPKLGLVSDANSGVLFIDEIGEMDQLLLNKLLKVLEDKRVFFESSYYESDDNNIPRYIKKLFKEGAPADFILIGATTRYPEELNPALRSRCAEVYFEPLSPIDIKEIVINSAQKLNVHIDKEVADLISRYTIEGRKANSILTDAYGLALYMQKRKKGRPPKNLIITKDHVLDVLQSSRITPFVGVEAKDKEDIGRILGLGVNGFIGSVLEIETVAFPAGEKGKGNIRFNETAGSMAKDSVFNAASVFRKICGKKLSDYDCHVNVVGGGNIDGPSAGLAITLALLSAVQQIPICQDIAITGEISIQGLVKPVGGIPEKIYGARQAGMRKVLVPKDNQKDIPVSIDGIQIVTVETVEDALKHLIKKDSTSYNEIVV